MVNSSTGMKFTIFLLHRNQYDYLADFLHSDKGNQNVTSVILNVLSLGESIDVFNSFASPPNRNHLDWERYKLQKWNLIGANQKMTNLGRRVNELAADPLVAKMMLWGSIFGIGTEVAKIGAGLANAQMFPMPEGHTHSRKSRKRNRHHKPPTRSQLTGLLTLSQSSDALSILGALQRYEATGDKESFCRQYLLDEESVGDVLFMTDIIKTELARLKGAEAKPMNARAMENIIGAAFLPNLAWTE